MCVTFNKDYLHGGLYFCELYKSISKTKEHFSVTKVANADSATFTFPAIKTTFDELENINQFLWERTPVHKTESDKIKNNLSKLS